MPAPTLTINYLTAPSRQAGIATHLGRETLPARDMSALRRLRNFWMLRVTAMVPPCFSQAVAQTRYKVTDWGVLHNGRLSCAMAVNHQGWPEIMDGNVHLKLWET